jgi:succinate dehydrogenase/fumarate reductase flavoprotein subunit
MELKYGCENYSTDVLVIGGGIGGLTAAVSIKEKDPDLNVMIVEKQTAGYSGKKPTRAAAYCSILTLHVLSRRTLLPITPNDVNTIGCFLGDQDLMATYVSNEQLYV